ncbi:MAG: DNA-directed RNA polymerase subunit beta [SAR324 cluster bacterium]|nr:DNA-directed RNA polymerase subunit beta [SAR324 cluster bacterium]MBL7034256.1 DNA-directed RNA polymerase subunit beta [SAR324 cluster bacterium]
MPSTLENRHRIRRSFGSLTAPIKVPHLLKVQLDSFERFLQRDVPPDQREDKGLEAVFRSVFPVSDFSGSSTLEYVHYRLGDPKYSVEECRVRGVTFACPVRAALRLIVWEKDTESDVKHIRDIKEQDIYLGELPLMTPTGSFIINGTERVIVSQMHKSPGVVFTHDKGKSHSSGKLLYSARVIPQRGSWLDFEFDAKDVLYVRIDRRRKFHATVLLRALGYTEDQLLEYFYQFEKLDLSEVKAGEDPEIQSYFRVMDPEIILNQRPLLPIADPKTGEVLVKAGQRINKRLLKKLEKAKIKRINATLTELKGRILARTVFKDNSEEILIPCNTPLTAELLTTLVENGVKEVDLLHIGPQNVGSTLRDTLELDKVTSAEQALIELYKKMKPGDPPTLESAQLMLQNFFFKGERYSLSSVGRLKINEKLGLDDPLDTTVLSNEDILKTVKYLLELREGHPNRMIDDIDHLGNRRVRSVGELLETQFRIGLVRMERTIKERMSLQDSETMMLHDIVNAKPVAGAIHEFFGSSQLSQFMDQTNPLSEITHKRRLSALGPGGLTRERAGFDVRDVHSSHYGRICPIETPEGPNIGLIASLATFARVNDFGFIETPYLKVENGVVTDKVEYLSAIEEEKYSIAQANAKLDKKKAFINDFITSRVGSDFSMVMKENIDYIDISPRQLVSVAAAMIPFLEHDDANRALMGSNMQRQGVPLVKPKAPLVGTGIEHQAALDSGSCVVASRSGVVDDVDAGRVVIQADVDLSSEDEIVPANVDIYHLIKYRRSNQNTCINQRPIVKKGDIINAGDVIADGSCTENGELALGQNINIAFMPWRGYNYEDSIMVSQRLMHEDTFTSVHIDVLDTVARDTKLGKEEITRDIPNVSEEALKNLDESGIIAVGTSVSSNDILVGKVTPKGETQLNPEEKLLRAIFGEKAGDVRDTSLRVPQGVDGVVTNVVVFNREGVERDERTRQIEQELLARNEKDHNDEIRIVHSNLVNRILSVADKKPLTADVLSIQGELLASKGTKISNEVLQNIPLKSTEGIQITDKKLNLKIGTFVRNALQQMYLLENVYQDRCEKVSKGDDLPPGVIRMIKVFIAIKRKLSVGDKMAGRHGNKGVVSTIQPVENMPYMEDGSPVDIVLNPLGVPSRMNVGQVLETHLGRVAKGLGKKVQEFLEQNKPAKQIRGFLNKVYDSELAKNHFDSMDDETFLEFVQKYKPGIHMATPVFDGAEESDIHRMAEMAGLSKSGQVWLYDGMTGERFSQKVTVGYAYILKLHHLVDEKIHARSIGPYSLVTQQPLGGKAQFGGQRFGEMEVWALEAYGAAYTLQELLTVKSDDVHGRNKIYESIVKGRHQLETGIPESFKVLISELKSLCLNIELLQKPVEDEDEDEDLLEEQQTAQITEDVTVKPEQQEESSASPDDSPQETEEVEETV